MTSIEPSSSPGKQRRPVDRPLVPYALAAMAGIVSDACWPTGPLFWLTAAAAAMAVATTHYATRRRGAVAATWLAALFAFGAWHHRCTQIHSAQDIGNWASGEPAYCRVKGRIDTEPTVSPKEPVAFAAPWLSSETTAFCMRVHEIADASGSQHAEGRLSVRVSAAVAGLNDGDTVEVIGMLRAPASPSNAGEFDYRQYLASRRVRAMLLAKHADCVTILDRLPWWSPKRWRNEIRAKASGLFRMRLGPDEAAIADAALLGKQRALTHNETTPFLESGTLHLLVVSGQHLAMLAGVLWYLGILAGLPIRGRAVAMIAVALLYAFLTGNDPPVVRSAVTITLFFGNYLISKPAQPLNSLAGAILVVLALDPADLFRGGPQLSFIAVLAILLLARPICHSISLAFGSRGWIVAVLGWVLQVFAVSFAACAVTAPLIMQRFHLFSPISMLFSPLLATALLALLIVGPIYVLTAPIAPALADPLATILQGAISLMRLSVRHTEAIPFSSCYLPSLPTWWVIGFYAFLFLPWCLPRFTRANVPYLVLNLSWILVGALAALYRPLPAGFEYHQLAVGHGICTVLRFPTGHTVLYDCGSMQGPMIAERTVAPWLWSQRIGYIDAVIVSHADLDHYSGVAELARRMPVGRIFIAPRFAVSHERGVKEFAQAVLDRGINLAFLWAQDKLRIGETTLDVLQPRADDRRGTDNSGSVVIEIRTGGRRFLLTGDLEGPGLAELLAQPVGPPVDVLMAPHHGGRASNTPELATWARPRWVLSSQENRHWTSDPLAAYELVDATVLRTNEVGTISCRLRGEELEVRTFRAGPAGRAIK